MLTHCGDLVFVFHVLFTFLLVLVTCVDQLAMKKRLRFAMPRVPLQQLKQQQNNGLQGNDEEEEPREEPISKLKALRIKIDKCIGTFKKKMDQEMPQTHSENVEEDTESVGDEETQLNDTMFAAAGQVYFDKEYSEVDVEPVKYREDQHTRKENKPHLRKHLTIKVEEMEAIRKIETRLKKANRGRKLRVVLESEDEEENGEIIVSEEGNIHKHLGLANIVQKQSEETQDAGFVVQADVHQEELPHLQEEQDATAPEQNGVKSIFSVSDTMENKDIEVTNDARKEQLHEMEHGAGVRPKKNFKQEKGKAKSKQRQKKRKYQERMHEKHSTVNWGLEESSESDGGWDFDNIPLLPR